MELLVFIGIVLLTDHFFASGTRFWSVSPHPFWLAVLLASCRYGINEGLLAAALSSTALLAFNLPQQPAAQDLHYYLLEVCYRPVLWFACAILFGFITSSRLEIISKKEDELKRTKKLAEDLEHAYEELSLQKENLEVKIAGQMSTAISAYHAFVALEKLEPSEVLLGVSDLVRVIMNAHKFSLYLLAENSLEVSITDGWSLEDGFSRTFPHDTRLFQEVVGKHRVLCVASAQDEQIFMGEGMIAGPVKTSSGRILGMLKIEQLNFKDLYHSSLENFRIICDWLGTAYDNATQYQAARQDSLLNDAGLFFSHGFFSHQTAFLVSLAKRLQFDLSMIIIRLVNPDKHTKEELIATPGILRESINSLLRITDLAFDYQKSGLEFAVLLPNNDQASARIVVNKLVDDLAKKSPKSMFSITIQVMYSKKSGDSYEK